ncbi:MAG: hypothetical protein IID54_02585 [Proteobacteria bacterium]|nr:hypothetical protein [Pseudomonadota bacterium]
MMERIRPTFPNWGRLEAIIENHLPDAGYEVNNRREAAAIGLAYLFCLKRNLAWKPEEEIAKLEKIADCIRTAINESEQLEGTIVAALVGNSSPIADKPEGVISTLRQVEHAMESGIKAAKEAARLGKARRGSGPQPSYDAVSVLEACREIWGRRGGKGSTKSAHADNPGPFAKFVEEVFEELNIKGHKGEIITAASAIRASKTLANRRKRRGLMLNHRRAF